MSDPTLQQWLDDNWIDKPELDTLIYRKAGWHQVMFVRDELAPPLRADVTVVSTHRSKSLILPVYRMTFKGIVLYMRENFYGWVVSVDAGYKQFSDNDFVTLPKGYVNFGPDQADKPDDIFHPVYAEGFKDEWCCLPFTKSKSKFTVRVANNYSLWMFCQLISHALN